MLNGHIDIHPIFKTAKTGYVAHLYLEVRWPYYGIFVFSAVVTFYASIFQRGIGEGLLRGGGGIFVGKLKLEPLRETIVGVGFKLKLTLRHFFCKLPYAQP